MTTKSIKIAKWLIIYLLINSLVIGLYLISKIADIINTFSLFFFTILIINIFIGVFNIAFLFRKNKDYKDWKLTLLFNSIFGFISGFSVRALGIIITNNYGLDFSPYFIKNQAGTDYGFNYGLYDFAIELHLYDTTKLTGFYIELNFVTLAISIFLLKTFWK